MAMPLADASAAEPALLRQRGSNHVGLGQFNERVVLQALRTHGSLAKAEIARVTGLTAQAIGLIAARLDAEQLARRAALGADRPEPRWRLCRRHQDRPAQRRLAAGGLQRPGARAHPARLRLPRHRPTAA